MSSVTIEQAQAALPEIIARLQPGQEIQITLRDRPVARLVAEAAATKRPRQPGSALGKLLIVSEDDQHLQDFREYMR